MDNELVICAVDAGIATLTLNDPAKLNPISQPLQIRLNAVLDQVRANGSVRAMIVTGAGKAFCAGADLSAIGSDGKQSLGEASAQAMRRYTNPIVAKIRELPFPVISAVNGPAAGGGVGIALAADIVLAARSAYFYLPFLAKLGIVPDVGSSWFLPRMIGQGRALGLALLGDKLSAERAVEWGLIWECVEDAALLERARVLARQLTLLPAHAALEARRAYAASERNSLGEQLEYEANRQRELIDHPDFSEGVRAFMEKRTPVFKAR